MFILWLALADWLADLHLMAGLGQTDGIGPADRKRTRNNQVAQASLGGE